MSKQIKKSAYYDYMLCKTFLHTLVFEDASSPFFLTYCRIYIFRVLREFFCGKFQIVCGFWNPANPAFRMYAVSPPITIWTCRYTSPTYAAAHQASLKPGPVLLTLSNTCHLVAESASDDKLTSFILLLMIN